MLVQQGVNALPGLQEDKELRPAGILQLASEALALALGAGRGNENPVGQSHGDE